MERPIPERAVHGGLARREQDERGWLDFSANLNPFPPRVDWTPDPACLEHYPDDRYPALREAIGRTFGRRAEEVTVGNGSIEVIRAFCLAALGPGDRVCIDRPTFGEYRVAAELAGAGATIEADGAAARFLCNPNNPTGALLGRSCGRRGTRRDAGDDPFLRGRGIYRARGPVCLDDRCGRRSCLRAPLHDEGVRRPRASPRFRLRRSRSRRPVRAVPCALVGQRVRRGVRARGPARISGSRGVAPADPVPSASDSPPVLSVSGSDRCPPRRTSSALRAPCPRTRSRTGSPASASACATAPRSVCPGPSGLPSARATRTAACWRGSRRAWPDPRGRTRNTLRCGRKAARALRAAGR